MGEGRVQLNYPFFELSNFLGSPHNSNYVAGAMEDACQAAAENVLLFLRGEPWHGKIRRGDYMDIDKKCKF
jgi:phosphoglycerate dehydrogenase-like enzyme